MNTAPSPATGLLASLDLLRIDTAGAVCHIRLNRPAKRNAISDELIAQLHTAFVNLPEGVRAVVLSGEGEHFCASPRSARAAWPAASSIRAAGMPPSSRSSSAACR